jgi:hypothetical protein
MQRPTAAVPLSCLVLLSAALLVVGGCANAPTSQLSTTPGTPNQGTNTQGSPQGKRHLCQWQQPIHFA